MRRAALLLAVLLCGPARAEPPRIVGGPGAGCIAGAVELPTDGPGYQTIRASRSWFWGHPDTIAALELLGRRAQSAGLPVLYMNDLSRPRGGPMAGVHASHMLGLDADVWLDLQPKPALTPAQRDAVEVASLVAPDGRGVDLQRWAPAHATLLRLAAGLPGVDPHPGQRRDQAAAVPHRAGRSRLDPHHPPLVWARRAHAHPFPLPARPGRVPGPVADPGRRRLRREPRLVVRAARPAARAARAAAGTAQAAAGLHRDPRRPPLTRRGLGVAAAGVCTFLNLYSTQALLPTLADQFGATRAQAGLTVTATLVAVALVAPIVGGVSDALGRRRLIVAACALLVVPTGLAALAPGLDALVAARFAQGLLLPFIFAVTVAYIAEECPGDAAVRTTATYAVGTILGGFAGRLVSGWATALAGWPAAFVALAILTASCAAVVAWALPPEVAFRPVRGWRGQAAGFADQFRNTQVMATCAVGFAVLFSMVATFTYAGFLLAAPPFRLGPAGLGMVFVTYLAGAVATPVATRLVLQFGRRRTVLLAGVVAAAGLLLTLAPSLGAILAGLALAAAGVFTQQVMSVGYVALAARRSRSTAVGLYVTCYYLGGSLGAIVPAGVWDRAGWPGCVALVLAVQAAAIAITQRTWPSASAQPP